MDSSCNDKPRIYYLCSTEQYWWFSVWSSRMTISTLRILFIGGRGAIKGLKLMALPCSGRVPRFQSGELFHCCHVELHGATLLLRVPWAHSSDIWWTNVLPSLRPVTSPPSNFLHVWCTENVFHCSRHQSGVAVVVHRRPCINVLTYLVIFCKPMKKFC